MEISQQQQRLGQVAQSDVVKAELSYQQQLQAYQEAALAMDNARLTLAVMLFPSLDANFTVVDDLGTAPVPVLCRPQLDPTALPSMTP